MPNLHITQTGRFKRLIRIHPDPLSYNLYNQLGPARLGRLMRLFLLEQGCVENVSLFGYA
ncbi:hypothetical protein GCM10010917_12980 [Paenibacillus physcomitrellae]|uniref:Uncharacterized protein n=1 Tax=Paenibacillus physcomitrellae TaxID=1619311 RepID=A0ABQ1FSL8_9BACL|nr:hypothetical protein GCM10010917_12980 [Paenibacillus physcomitrellae]